MNVSRKHFYDIQIMYESTYIEIEKESIDYMIENSRTQKAFSVKWIEYYVRKGGSVGRCCNAHTYGHAHAKMIVECWLMEALKIKLWSASDYMVSGLSSTSYQF